VSHPEIGNELEAELFRAMQSKDAPALRELTRGLSEDLRRPLLALPGLYGGAEILNRARRELPAAPDIVRALDELQTLCERLRDSVASLCLDLSELRGYEYHSGVVFAAYSGGAADSLGRGGRYDEVGKAFGRARPATGFSIDLRDIARITQLGAPPHAGILAPAMEDSRLQQKVSELRACGERVVQEFPDCERDELECDRELRLQNGEWKVVRIEE